jgi:hypothetical protein
LVKRVAATARWLPYAETFELARQKLNLLYEDIKARDVAKKKARKAKTEKEQVTFKGLWIVITNPIAVSNEINTIRSFECGLGCFMCENLIIQG